MPPAALRLIRSLISSGEIDRKPSRSASATVWSEQVIFHSVHASLQPRPLPIHPMSVYCPTLHRALFNDSTRPCLWLSSCRHPQTCADKSPSGPAAGRPTSRPCHAGAQKTGGRSAVATLVPEHRLHWRSHSRLQLPPAGRSQAR